MNICVTVISFLVSVPVLSEQMTLQQPADAYAPSHKVAQGGAAHFRARACVCVCVRTQRLDDGKLLDDGSLLDHAHDAQCQRHSHHNGETLGNGRHRQTAGNSTPLSRHFQQHVCPGWRSRLHGLHSK